MSPILTHSTHTCLYDTTERELEGVRISAGLLHIAARRDALASTLVILHIAAHKRKELREQGVTTVTNPR